VSVPAQVAGNAAQQSQQQEGPGARKAGTRTRGVSRPFPLDPDRETDEPCDREAGCRLEGRKNRRLLPPRGGA